MIAKWNGSQYGSQNGNSSYTDMWGLSTVQSKINSMPAWYVPSREEWATFGGELGITSENYGNMSLRNIYWSSSIANEWATWGATYHTSNITGCNMVQWNPSKENVWVRLGTTF